MGLCILLGSRCADIVLQKVGITRRIRYRFINPLLQPFVILKGVQDSIVNDAMLAQGEYARPR